MIIYEVNIEVQQSIAKEFRMWLSTHVREVLKLPGFLSAEIFERIDPVCDDETVAICVQYRLHREEDLRRYFDHYAQRMREDGLQRFPEQFRAHRRVLLRAETQSKDD